MEIIGTDPYAKAQHILVTSGQGLDITTLNLGDMFGYHQFFGLS